MQKGFTSCKRRTRVANSPKTDVVNTQHGDYGSDRGRVSPSETDQSDRSFRHKCKDVRATKENEEKVQHQQKTRGRSMKHPSLTNNEKSLDHIYFCTKCRRSYKNSDDCKKHEKEYEEVYICRAREWYRRTANGPICGFCGILRPDHEHFEVHDAVCRAADQTPTTFKRRYDMVRHLPCHNIQGGKDIADKWKVHFSKKAYACGFCVHYFANLKERLRHIHDEHFKQRRQSMDEWDDNKVLHGLLEQPDIKEHWESLQSELTFPLSSFRWSQAAVDKLLVRLEDGPTVETSAMALAQEAFDELELDFDSPSGNQLMETQRSYGGREQHPTSILRMDTTSPSQVKLEPRDPERTSQVTRQSSHRSNLPGRPQIKDPWNYMADDLSIPSNAYMSPDQDLLSPLSSSNLATPYTDALSTYHSVPSFQTPSTRSVDQRHQLPVEYYAPKALETPMDTVEQAEGIDICEGNVDFLTRGAFGASPDLPNGLIHDPPSPSKSPSVTQRIKRAYRKRSKLGLCGNKVHPVPETADGSHS